MPLDTTINIVAVDDVLIELGLDESERSRIERLVNAVSQRVESYTRNIFKQRSAVLTLDGPSTQLLDLGGRIISVSAVTLGGKAQAASDYQVLNERGQLYRTGGWSDPVTNGAEGVRNVSVTCVRGFATIPYDVQEMVFSVIRSWRGGSFLSGGFQSERIGDYSYTRFSPGTVGASSLFSVPVDLGESIASVLSPYVRHGF